MTIADKTTTVNFIGGEWRPGSSAEMFEVFNPASSDVLGCINLADRLDVDVAVAAASVAFSGWRRTPPHERIQYLFKFKNLCVKFDSVAASGVQQLKHDLRGEGDPLRRVIERWPKERSRKF